jgi:hypothetical protein
MAMALESEDALTTDRTDARNRRIEVITRRECRRRWTAEQKREIAAEWQVSPCKCSKCCLKTLSMAQCLPSEAEVVA